MTQINTTRWIEAADARQVLAAAAFDQPTPERASLSEQFRDAVAALQFGIEEFVAAHHPAASLVPARAARRHH